MRLLSSVGAHPPPPSPPRSLSPAQTLSSLVLGDNALTTLPPGLADLNQKKLRDFRLLPNPFADKKVLKVRL